MASHTIYLPDEKSKTLRYVTLFILLINGFAFGFLLFHVNDSLLMFASIAGMSLAATALFLFLFREFKKLFTSFRPWVFFILLGLCWLLTGNYLTAICVLLFAVMGFYADEKPGVVFSDEHIRYPSFPPKKIRWNEVNQVLLKDDVLTIDLENNKLIQFVLDKESAGKVDEKEFNEFCLERLGGRKV